MSTKGYVLNLNKGLLGMGCRPVHGVPLEECFPLPLKSLQLKDKKRAWLLVVM